MRFHSHPGNETDDSVANGSKPESVDQTESTTEQKPTETPAAEPVTETKAEEKVEQKAEETAPVPESKPEPVQEAPKAEPAPVVSEKVDKDTIQEVVDKVQASKDGQVGTLEDPSDKEKSKCSCFIQAPQ